MLGIGIIAHLVRVLHFLAVVTLSLAAAAAVTVTLLSAFGRLPWLALDARFGDMGLPWAGMALQIGLTALLVCLAFFIPANGRIMALERSHRRFQIGMEDVARAYHLCHTADRAGLFTLSSEFDAVRERLAYLRDHPDLANLEPEILTIAAQMSTEARHLAEIYSDAKVSRARDFLRQRQHEAEAAQERIVEALQICREIQTWTRQVEAEEGLVAKQLATLDEALQRALPKLGYAVEVEGKTNVVPMPAKPAAG